MKSKNRPRNRSPRIDLLEPRTHFTATFNAPVFYGGMDTVAGIAVGSLTSSGKKDIVVTGLRAGTAQPALGVYLNQGNGTFKTPTLLNFSGTPSGVAMGDFLGNGKLDVAAVDASANTVDVFLNDGTGNFSPGVGAGLGGTGGDTAITVGDFNSDGKADFAVVDPSGNQVVVEISRGDQFGSFVGGADIAVPSPVNAIAADVNGDNKPDLVVASSANSGSVYVAINDGTGNFAPAVSYALGASVTSASDLSVADFNADQHPDIVVLGQVGSTGSIADVLLNQGAGTFGAATDYATSAGASVIGTGNFTNTGGVDIADITTSGGLDVLAHGGAIGTFQASQPVFTNQLGAPGNRAVFADFDGDGKTDIAYLDSAQHGFGVLIDTTGNVVPPPGGGGGGTSALTPALVGALPVTPLVAGTKLRPIHEKFVVTNSGATAVNGAVKIDLLLSSSTTPATGDPSLATVTQKVRLKPHQKHTFLLTVRTLPASANGSYYLVGQVTDPSLNTATIASATTVSVVPPTIDLSGAFVSVPATVKLSHPVAVTFTISNAGSVPTNKPLEIKVYASSSGTIDSSAVVIGDVLRPGLIRPGKPVRVRLSRSTRPLAAANYFLIVQLDPTNVLNDTNPTNNTFVSPAAIAVM